MKAILISILLTLTGVLIAAEPATLELRTVADAPTKTTKKYSLPQRGGVPKTVYLESTLLLDRTAIAYSMVERKDDGSPILTLVLKGVSAKRIAEIMEQHRAKRLGIVLSGKLISANVKLLPGVQVGDHFLDGFLEISDEFTQEEAKALAGKINESLQ